MIPIPVHVPAVSGPAAGQPWSVAAAITAGGQSRRFGRDKALYPVEGVPLLGRVAASLQEHAPRLLIAPEGRYVLGGWQNVADLRPGEGPLAGLETALSVLASSEAAGAWSGWLAFSAVDLPHLTPGYWRLLGGRAAAGAQAVVGLDAHGQLQPLAALYHVSVLPLVTALLDAGERRMRALLGQVRAEVLPWTELAPTCPDVYINLNTPPADPPPADLPEP